jgi:hypothetical protein
MLLAASAAFAQSAVLECTADSWVASREARASHGHDTELHVQGNKTLTLLNFRFTAVPGWKIRKATLIIHQQDLSTPSQIGVAVVPIDWSESEVTYEEASAGKKWTGPKANLSDLLFKAPNARTAFAPVAEKQMGWVSVDIPPDLVNEIMGGRGFGLALFQKSLRAAITFDARESVRYAPYLLVEGNRL